MTESRLVLSIDALADLAEIQNYIIGQDGEMRATAAMSRLRRALSSVSFMPGIGRKRADIGGRALLFHPVKPWLVAYTILPSNDGIFVRRIVDGRRNLKRIFEGFR